MPLTSGNATWAVEATVTSKGQVTLPSKLRKRLGLRKGSRKACCTKALKAASSGAVGFADMLIAQVAFAHRAGEVITFNKVFGKQLRVRRLS